MKKIFYCRRSSLALISIAGLLTLGFMNPEAVGSVCLAIPGIVGAVAGANAYQKSKQAQYNEGQPG